jgi:LmbE family N-acetylglucosaminyl deacetylase
MIDRYHFKSVKRFVFPAPVPYIFREDDLLRNHKIMVCLPHSDDGRYCGCTLHLLNKNNDMRIVIVSPGYRGVEEPQSIDQKTELRWKEALSWAEKLGFRADQIINFRADKTYRTQRINGKDMRRLFALYEKEKPTAVFLPHISDTAQAINYHTRKMVMKAVLHGLKLQAENNQEKIKPVLLFEYPTNHVPLLPPSDKNLTIFFEDPNLAKIKHDANLAHKSQSIAYFDIQGKFAEAMMAIEQADTIYHASKRLHLAESLSSVEVNPQTSRGEHFGVTKISLQKARRLFTEERIRFPLSNGDKRLWISPT